MFEFQEIVINDGIDWNANFTPYYLSRNSYSSIIARNERDYEGRGRVDL